MPFKSSCPLCYLFVFLFVLLLLVYCSKLFCVVNQNRTKGEGWSTENKFKSPSNFIAGRPKAALLFWFFGDFTCGVSLFIVILVIY